VGGLLKLPGEAKDAASRLKYCGGKIPRTFLLLLAGQQLSYIVGFNFCQAVYFTNNFIPVIIEIK
jgi:hypothetical protein